MGTYPALVNGPASARPAFPLPRHRGAAPAFFRPVAPSRADELILPRGYRYDVVCAWGDHLGSRDPQGRPETFGFNNDFIAYFPIDALRGGHNSTEGLLWVNHEYPDPLFVRRYRRGVVKTEQQIVAEKLSVGGSVLHLRRRRGRWEHVPGSQYTRRFTALYPRIPLTGPAAAQVPEAVGTLANCSGGRTPWYTALSCEENYPDFNDTEEGGYRWSDVERQEVDESQYGWVVEVDPFGELPPRKHSALGRFKHENSAWRLGPTGKLVIYMGDDEEDQFFYKYVSAERYRPGAPRADQRQLLTNGTLYAADFLSGRWLPLDIRRRDGQLRDEGFPSQADVLLRTREAAQALGATPIDRPEDCEVHPLDGTVYIALTNNTSHGNLFGQIVRLLEDNDDPEGERFRFEIFLAGGPQCGLACPDNLLFDRHGNLWVACDVDSDVLNHGAYRPFGNNGFHVVPTRGPSAGDAFQFASGPVGCELTGPWFTEDEQTLFLSVQHPGEESTDFDNPISHWPGGGRTTPRPAVVAITGFPSSAP
jgi:secreted PhoX family phosphatase